MSLTALEWGLRAPITPRFGGNLEALSRALKIPNQNNNKKPTSNTKNRIAPDADIKRLACLVCGLTHSLPFYTIGFMRLRSSKRPQSEAAKGFHVI